MGSWVTKNCWFSFHTLCRPSTASLGQARQLWQPRTNQWKIHHRLCALKPPWMDFQLPCLITRGYGFLLDGVSCHLEPIGIWGIIAPSYFSTCRRLQSRKLMRSLDQHSLDWLANAPVHSLRLRAMPAMCAMEARKADHKIMSSISSANILEKNWKKRLFRDLRGFAWICIYLDLVIPPFRSILTDWFSMIVSQLSE